MIQLSVIKLLLIIILYDKLCFALPNLRSEHLQIQKCTYKQAPGALIIGVKKSGTYALLRYLSINPRIKSALKISGCNLNEIHYFDHDENYEKGVEWYKSQMPNLDCNKDKNDSVILIEKTPGYFRSEKTPQRVQKFNPNMKLILIVRDPVRRVQSELTHCEYRQRKLNLQRKCSRFNSQMENFYKSNESLTLLEENKFIRNSIYYLDLQRWLAYFNLSQMFILNGEDFIKSPWTELNKLEDFLNVSRFIRREHFHFDKRKNFFCFKNFTRLSFNENGIDHGDDFSPTGCLGKNKGRKTHVYLSDVVKVKLRNYFQRWNDLFFQTINQSFNW